MKPLDRLDNSIKKYREIQLKQLISFETELMPDLETLKFERSAAFSEMKIELDHFLNFSQAEQDIDVISFYQSEIESILATDNHLRGKIDRFKNDLKKHMYETNSHKNAIGKYARATGV